MKRIVLFASVFITLLAQAQSPKLDWVSKVGAKKFPSVKEEYKVAAASDTSKIITKKIQAAIDRNLIYPIRFVIRRCIHDPLSIRRNIGQRIGTLAEGDLRNVRATSVHSKKMATFATIGDKDDGTTVGSCRRFAVKIWIGCQRTPLLDAVLVTYGP